MIASSSTFCPHQGRVSRDLFRQLHAVWHSTEALVYSNHPREPAASSYLAIIFGRIASGVPWFPPPHLNIHVRPSQNLPLSPTIYPLSNIYMRRSQNLPPLSESTPFFQNYKLHSQNLPLLPRIYAPPPLTYISDPPRIYHSLPEYTPFKHLYATLLESTLPLRIYPLFPKL